MTAIILAGGKSSRIRNSTGFIGPVEGCKAFLELWGKTVLDRMLDALEGEFDRIIVVTSFEQKAIYEKQIRCRAEIVIDIVPGSAALGGLYTGLSCAESESVFVFACDMPFVRKETIRCIRDAQDGYDALVPVAGGFFEPLHAVYSKRCIGIFGELLAAGIFRIASAFPRLRMLEIGENRLRETDPELVSFFNINTQEDYEAAIRMLESRELFIKNSRVGINI